MTLTSLLLRLFILGARAESGVLPPLFLFARGLRGGRLGTFASGPPVFYSIVKLRAAGAAQVEKNVMGTFMRVKRDGVRPIGLEWGGTGQDRKGSHANARRMGSCGAVVALVRIFKLSKLSWSAQADHP